MPEQLWKLSPDRDLQCFYVKPSAVAALSSASSTGFTLSGTWRQQFDWAVVEWNRDNVYEHPTLRYLPDGDLSGLVLSYEETRTNCIPIESDLFPTVDWPYLRIWAADASGVEHVYYVKIRDHATPVAGAYQSATGQLTLTGSITAGDLIGVVFLDEQYNYQVQPSDTLESAVNSLAFAVNSFSQTMHATASGAALTLTYQGNGTLSGKTGANGNRVGAYGYVNGARTEVWSPLGVVFSGGVFPSRYRVDLNFQTLQGSQDSPSNPLAAIPMQRVRKMRWTWAADLQPGNFARSEFSVGVSNWTVSGTSRQYFVAGPGSRRIEDDSPQMNYTGAWIDVPPGNYSGSTIRYTEDTSASLSCGYSEPSAHQLYLGSRFLVGGSTIQVTVDNQAPQQFNLNVPGEDVLVRLPLGNLGAGTHTVTVANLGPGTNRFYFDFLEIAHPVADLPEVAPQPQLALATDFDTDHSLALPAERTAWMIQKLGFRGRVNYYVGALVFYELVRMGHQYASATVTFAGTPTFSAITELRIGRTFDPPGSETVIQHLNLLGETPETIAKAFELRLNQGSTAIHASANGSVLTITSRFMGVEGNTITLAASPSSGSFSTTVSSPILAGGVDGTSANLSQDALLASTLYWRTDLMAMPRINRACRDWSRAFFTALHGYGMDAVAAFSTELQHVDPGLPTGMAQRYPDGTPVVLNTPSIQTNFSPTSIAYWTQVYLDMAQLQMEAGLTPFLQSGEVQWWYFPKAGVGMTFYDAYTQQRFQATYGTAMQVIPSNLADPALYPNEVAFLPALIGTYTAAIRAALKTAYPNCRYEVLYPIDVNDSPLNQLINYPTADWTPANLTILKTEGLSYTIVRNVDLSRNAIEFGTAKGFSNAQRSHLVGITDAKIPWKTEVDLAQAQGMESVVLFAIDQFCLIGYDPPPFQTNVRSSRQG